MPLGDLCYCCNSNQLLKFSELGGYQVWTGFHSFVAKGTGEMMVKEAVQLLSELENLERSNKNKGRN